jgi:2-haloalkanoic acid dehalogenase type II
MNLTDFTTLTFDCYGTLIDWESGIMTAIAPLVARSGLALTRDAVLETFARHEGDQERLTPAMRYSELLAVVHGRIAREWNVAADPVDDARFGASVPDWPAFIDSADALQYLQRYYKLVILSNVDRASFAASNAKLQVAFDHVFTAEDVGSYKPDLRNFDYMLARLATAGIGKTQILHTAESLFHDHVPANAVGLASAWIHRRHAQGGFGATTPPADMPRVDFKFNSMTELAKAHQDALRAL